MLGALRGCGPPLGLRRPDVANKRSVSPYQARLIARMAERLFSVPTLPVSSALPLLFSVASQFTSLLANYRFQPSDGGTRLHAPRQHLLPETVSPQTAAALL